MAQSKLYQIPFTGYCEVWAETPEEAALKAEEDYMFTVQYRFGEPICTGRVDEDEMD